MWYAWVYFIFNPFILYFTIKGFSSDFVFLCYISLLETAMHRCCSGKRPPDTALLYKIAAALNLRSMFCLVLITNNRQLISIHLHALLYSHAERLAEAAQINGHIRPSSRPQAMEGSPEGQVPLAPSAQDRPPRRRIKRQSPALTSITTQYRPMQKKRRAIRRRCRQTGFPVSVCPRDSTSFTNAV